MKKIETLIEMSSGGNHQQKKSSLLQMDSVSELQTWTAVVALALGAFSLIVSEFLPIGILTLIASDLQVSTGTAGAMIFIVGLTMAVSSPLVVIGSRGLDRRYLILILSGLMVVANVLSALTPGFAIMIAARILLGISLGGFWAIAPALGVQLVKEGSGARATTIILAGISAGTILGLPAGVILGDWAGWRIAFGSFAFFGGMVFVIQFFFLPKIPAPPNPGFTDLLKVFQEPMARVGLLATLLVFVGHFSAYTYIRPFFLDIAQLKPERIALLFLTNGVFGLVGNVAAGYFIPNFLAASLVVTSSVLGIILLVLPVCTSSVFMISALFVLWGFVFGAIPFIVTTWMMAALPDAKEAGSAVMVSTMGISIALGSLLGGLLVDFVGVVMILPIAGFLALIAGLLVKKRRSP